VSPALITGTEHDFLCKGWGMTSVFFILMASPNLWAEADKLVEKLLCCVRGVCN
jgi:hypothetical protein